MAVDLEELLCDLAEESAALDARLTDLDAEHWHRATPAAGWSVLDQVTHLAYFDDAARMSATDPQAFAVQAQTLASGDGSPDTVAEQHRHLSGEAALAWWRSSRASYLAAMRAADPAQPLPWFGPPMSVASSVTARLMETWAHGHDIAAAIGVEPVPGKALRHVAYLGTRTFAWSFQVHGLDVPDTAVRTELTGPSGQVWTFGPPDAEQRVTGSAEEFCLVVTQRRAWAQTGLRAEGDVARQWLSIAQVFAGAPTRRR